MKKSKNILICVAIFGGIVFLITLVFILLPIGLRIDTDDICRNLSVNSLPQTQESICFSSDGNVYILTNVGMLKSSREDKMENLALGVDRILPTDQGVLYTNLFGSLYYRTEEAKIKIAKNVSAFAWDGDRILYCTDSGLFSCANNETKCITTFSDINVTALFANENYIILEGSWKGFFLCTEAGHLEEMGIARSSPNKFILFGDYIVIIGDGDNGAMLYHLPTGTEQSLNIGWCASEHFNKISTASDGQYIYLSVQSEIWPQFRYLDNSPVKTVTLRIDPDSWTTEIISPNFFDGLICADGIVYGLELSLVIARWIPIE